MHGFTRGLYRRVNEFAMILAISHFIALSIHILQECHKFDYICKKNLNNTSGQT